MGALPKKKLTIRRRANRARSQKISLPSYINCTNCKKPILPHVVCPYCGYYRNRQILKIKEQAKVRKIE